MKKRTFETEAERKAFFALMNDPASVTRNLVDARRPNTAPAHNDDAYLERFEKNADQMIKDVIEATKDFRK